MKHESVQSAEERGLLANGSSRRWDIAVDQTLDGDEWSLEIDGPQVYVVFQLRNLRVIAQALRFLQSGPPGKRTARNGPDDAETSVLQLGRYGSASVSLIWDNEDFPRCFLVLGPKARSTMRLSLDAEDIQMLSEALYQVVKDLPHSGAESKGDS